MEHSLHFELGRVVWREEQGQITLEFFCRDDKLGLYKAWIAGSGPPLFLGTLLPEEGALHLRRSLPQKTLEAQHCWPVRTAGATLTHRFHAEEGFRWAECPAPAQRFAGSPALLSLLGEARGCLFREESEEGRWRLAIPFAPHRPFPLTPLFCLCKVQTIQGENYAVYTFDDTGLPKVPAP